MGLVVAREQGAENGAAQDATTTAEAGGTGCSCVTGMGSKAMWSLVERHRGLDFQLDPRDCLRLLGVEKPCSETCPCAPAKSVLASVDCLQLVGAAICFSSTSRKSRLAALFDVFDFDRRGSLSFEELFLLLDTCCAGVERFGGGRFVLPSQADLELVADILFSATPHDRLSRAAFVNNTCQRARAWLQVFEGLSIQGGDSLPFIIPAAAKRDGGLARSERILGDPHSVCGCLDAFFMMDGRLVRVAGPMLVASSVQPRNDGRQDPGQIGWFHSESIIAVAYSWSHDLIATACARQIVVWAYPSLDPIAVVDTTSSTVAMSWARDRVELCAADARGVVRMFSLVREESSEDSEEDSEIDSEIDDGDDESASDEDEESDDEFERGLANSSSRTASTDRLKRPLVRTRQEAVFQLPPAAVLAMTHVEDDRVLVCGRGGLAEILDQDTGEHRRVGFDAAPEVDFVSAAYHPRSKFAVLGGGDAHLHVVEGFRVTRAMQAFGPGEAVKALHACSRGFTTASPATGLLKLWSLNVQLVAEFDEMTRAPSLDTGAERVCWSSEGSRIAVTTRACEVFLVHGVSGGIVGDGGVSSGHPGLQERCWLPGARLLTAGRDCTLRLWDMSSLGHLESTCMVDREALVITAREVTHPKRVTVCALGHTDGFSVLERDDAERTWTEKYAVREPGFAGRLLTLSPCGRYLFAEDRVYDLRACEEFCRLPERTPLARPRFLAAGGKGGWHVSFNADNTFEVSHKSVLRKKGLRRIKLPGSASEYADLEDIGVEVADPVYLETYGSARGWFYSLAAPEPVVRSDAAPPEFALRASDQAPQDISALRASEDDDKPGQEDDADTEIATEEKEGKEEALVAAETSKNPQQAEVSRYEAIGYDRTVQGCKGARGECIASLGRDGLVAYAASDTIVVSRARDGQPLYLRMFAQVVCVRSCPAITEEGSAWWWLVACDTLCVAVWRVRVANAHDDARPGQGPSHERFPPPAKCALWARMRVEGVSQVDVSSAGVVAYVDKHGEVFVWRLQTGIDDCETTGEFASMTAAAQFPLVDAGSRMSVVEVSGASIAVAELDTSGQLWMHEPEGRKYRVQRVEHAAALTCLWRDWCGDAEGSLWRLDVAHASLRLLEAKAHEGKGVMMLRDGVSVSENSVLRVWSPLGKLEEVVDAKLIPGRVDGVCRTGAVVDGHRVIGLREPAAAEVLTSAHTKVWGLCRARNGLWVSLGERDTSVCLWTPELSLLNEVMLDTRSEAVCTSVAFSHDSDLVAIGTSTGSVHIRTVASHLSEEAIRLRSGESASSAVRCLAWSPAATKSSSFRLAVGRDDGTMIFYDAEHAMIRKPLAPMGGAWRWPPQKVEFADDCEIVRMLDADGKECFADSVSANPIPEESLEKSWAAAHPVDGVEVHVSVLRRGFAGAGLDEKVAYAQAAVDATHARGRRSVVGVTQGMPRQFNRSGELVRVGGDGAVALDLGSQKQRAVGLAVPGAVDACAFSRDARLMAVTCRGPPRVVLVFDTLTGELRGGAHTLSEKLVVESIAVSMRGNVGIVGRVMEKESACRGDDEDAGDEQDDDDDEDLEEARGMLVAVYVEAESGVQMQHVLLDDLKAREETVAAARGCTFVDGRSFMCLGVAKTLRHAAVVSAHEGALRLAGVEIFPACITVLSCGLAGDAEGHVHFVDEGIGARAVRAHPGAAIEVVSRQSASLVWASADSLGRVRVWRGRTCIGDLRVAEGSLQSLLSVDRGGVRVVTGTQEIALEDPDHPSALVFLGHTKRCSCATTSWCGRFVFTAGRDLIIRRWDADLGQVQAQASLDGVVVSMAYCGARIYLVNEDGVLQALDAEHLDLAHEIRLPRATIKRIVGVPGNADALTLVDETTSETYVLHTDSFKTAGPYPFSGQGAPRDVCTDRALVRGTACVALP